MSKSPRSLPILIVSLITLTGLLSSSMGTSCATNRTPVKIESVTFANLRLVGSALVYIAQDKGYFSENSLNVTIKENDTGVATTNALMKGEADLGTMAEFLMVSNAMQKQPLRILGTMDKTNTMVLIGLKNRGIERVSDLSGKRIGLGRGTSSEFYLGRFLELNGLKTSNIIVVDVPPSKMLASASSDNVDAVVTWAPYSMQIQDRSPNGTIVWQVQSGQPVFGLVVGNTDWMVSHPDSVIRFWRSLSEAQKFLLDHPSESKELLRQHLGLERSYIDSIWPQYEYSLSLDEALVVAMEDESRWLIKSNLSAAKEVPNFTDYISENALKTVKPEAVNLFR